MAAFGGYIALFKAKMSDIEILPFEIQWPISYIDVFGPQKLNIDRL